MDGKINLNHNSEKFRFQNNWTKESSPRFEIRLKLNEQIFPSLDVNITIMFQVLRPYVPRWNPVDVVISYPEVSENDYANRGED